MSEERILERRNELLRTSDKDYNGMKEWNKNVLELKRNKQLGKETKGQFGQVN